MVCFCCTFFERMFPVILLLSPVTGFSILVDPKGALGWTPTHLLRMLMNRKKSMLWNKSKKEKMRICYITFIFDFFLFNVILKTLKTCNFFPNCQLTPPPSTIPPHGKNSGSAPMSCFVLFLLWNTVHSEKGFEITWSLKFWTWFTMMYMFGCMYTFHSPIDSGYSSSKSTVFTIPISPNVHDVRTTL